MMDCFFPSEPLKLIFDPYWLKPVAVWEAGKKPSINHKTRGQTSQRGQRSEVEKPKRLGSPETLGAAASESFGSAAAAAAAIALFHVKPTREPRQVVYQDKVVQSSPRCLK